MKILHPLLGLFSQESLKYTYKYQRLIEDNHPLKGYHTKLGIKYKHEIKAKNNNKQTKKNRFVLLILRMRFRE